MKLPTKYLDLQRTQMFELSDTEHEIKIMKYFLKIKYGIIKGIDYKNI